MSIMKFAPFGRPPTPELIAWALEGLGSAIRAMGLQRVEVAVAVADDPSEDQIEAMGKLHGHFGGQFELGDYNYEFVARVFETLGLSAKSDNLSDGEPQRSTITARIDGPATFS